MDIVIDHLLLARALDYYEDLGYTRVELPWAVPGWALQMTCPNIEDMPKVGDDYLVASGEQAFLFCDERGLLPPGQYVALTPCFRPGDDKGLFHQESFMKIELYRTDNVDRYAVDEMLLQVSEFARQELRGEDYLLEVVDTPEQDGESNRIPLLTTGSCDINLNGIEIGSYGRRHCNEFAWAYGTGLAEPRFSQARNYK